MKKPYCFYALFIFLVISINVRGQNNDCGCDIALKNALRDEITSIYNVDLESSFKMIFSKSFEYWETGEWEKDMNMQSGGQAYYDLFSGFLNGSYNESEKRAKFQRDSIAFQVDKKLSFSQYKYLSQKTVSLTAYTAWSNCMHDCPNFEGCFITKHPEIDGQVTIDLFCKSIHQFSPIKITQIEHPNVIIIGGQLKEGKKIKWGQEYSGTFKLIDPNKDGIVKINLENNWKTDEVIISSKNQILKKPVTDSTIYISNGFLNVNSKMSGSWGTIAPNPVNQWLAIPVNDESRKYDAAWLRTKAAVTSFLSTNFYSWTLDIENVYGARTSPNGSGFGNSYVYPEYRTIMNLPLLQNYTDMNYSVLLKCEMNVDYLHPPYPPNYQYKGRVEIRGKDMDKTFYVQLDSSSMASMRIDDIQPGVYSLEMKGYSEGASVAGFAVPTSLPQQSLEGAYKIKLEANITKLGNYIQPTTNSAGTEKKHFVLYLIVAAIVIALILFWFFYRRQK